MLPCTKTQKCGTRQQSRRCVLSQSRFLLDIRVLNPRSPWQGRELSSRVASWMREADIPVSVKELEQVVAGTHKIPENRLLSARRRCVPLSTDG